MKRCSSCTETKPLDQFYKRAKAKDGHQTWCKVCAIKIRLEHYHADHETTRKKNKDRGIRYYNENREYIGDYLRCHPCVDCGEPDPIVLEFDHVRDTKSWSISTAIWSHPLSRIITEIAKCEVRCANCHRRQTAQRGGWTR